LRRRTQAERKASTVAKLTEACIEILFEKGYAGCSVSLVCKRAGLSQGALFRHFPTRVALLVHTAVAIEKRQLQRFHDLLKKEMSPQELIANAVHLMRQTCRDEQSMAWREIQVAARTDDALREGIREPLLRFEEAILKMALALPNAHTLEPQRLGMILLSLLHMFDSEAVTENTLHTEFIETMRHDWACELLGRELGLTVQPWQQS
jgi:AcrR family transcriptional regulator